MKEVGTPSQSEHSGLGVKSKVQLVPGKWLITNTILLSLQNVYIKANALNFSHSRLSRYISLFLKTVYKQLRRGCAVLQIQLNVCHDVQPSAMNKVPY